jgi:hypothetical protein
MNSAFAGEWTIWTVLRIFNTNVWESEMSRPFVLDRTKRICHYANRGFCSGKYERCSFLQCDAVQSGRIFWPSEEPFTKSSINFFHSTRRHIWSRKHYFCDWHSYEESFLSSSSLLFCSNTLDHYVSRNFSVTSLKLFWNMRRAEEWLVGWLVWFTCLEIMLVSSAACRKTHCSFIISERP